MQKNDFYYNNVLVAFDLFVFDIKRKLQKNYFYFFWYALEPLLLIAIFLFIRGKVDFRLNDNSYDYFSFIIIGITIYFTFINSVQNTIEIIKDLQLRFKNSEIQSFISITYIFISNFFNMFIYFFLFLFLVNTINDFSMTSILILYYFIMITILGSLIGILLSTLTIIFDELGKIINLLLRLALFVSGVIFIVDTSTFFIDINTFNPLFLIIQNARDTYLNKTLYINYKFIFIVLFFFPLAIYNFNRSKKFLKEIL